MKEERNLKKELEELNIISFDSDGITTKEDMFVSLDAIRNFIEENPDEEALAYISQKKKEKSRFFAR